MELLKALPETKEDLESQLQIIVALSRMDTGSNFRANVVPLFTKAQCCLPVLGNYSRREWSGLFEKGWGIIRKGVGVDYSKRCGGIIRNEVGNNLRMCERLFEQLLLRLFSPKFLEKFNI